MYDVLTAALLGGEAQLGLHGGGPLGGGGPDRLGQVGGRGVEAGLVGKPLHLVGQAVVADILVGAAHGHDLGGLLGLGVDQRLELALGRLLDLVLGLEAVAESGVSSVGGVAVGQEFDGFGFRNLRSSRDSGK